MLSRAQEARVHAILWSSQPGPSTPTAWSIWRPRLRSRLGTCLIAVFVRTLHERGDCQRRFGGFCDADQHETKQTLVWGPPTRLVAQGLT